MTINISKSGPSSGECAICGRPRCECDGYSGCTRDAAATDSGVTQPTMEQLADALEGEVLTTGHSVAQFGLAAVPVELVKKTVAHLRHTANEAAPVATASEIEQAIFLADQLDHNNLDDTREAGYQIGLVLRKLRIPSAEPPAAGLTEEEREECRRAAWDLRWCDAVGGMGADRHEKVKRAADLLERLSTAGEGR